MILYRQATAQPVVPAWLEDAEGVVHRCTEAGGVVGIGDPLYFNPPERGWKPIGDGWETALVGKLDPALLTRRQRFYDLRPVEDLTGRQWMAPVILREDGERAFRFAYGADWLPALTPEQERAEAIAKAARAGIMGGGDGVPWQAACQWAAELLCLTAHITPMAFAAHALVDDMLVPSVLSAATSLTLRKE